MDRIQADFVAATRARRRGGIRLARASLRARLSDVELHFAAHESAHGSNTAGRSRIAAGIPLEVFRAMRAAWPRGQADERAHLGARLGSRRHYARGRGDVARLFKCAGADVIDCSSGQVSKAERPVYGRMFQVPFSDRIRNEVGIPTIAVGNIFEGDHVNTIIAAGRADLCAVARPHLADPAWTLHEAAKQGYTDMWWPIPYLNGKEQLERNLARAALLRLQV